MEWKVRPLEVLYGLNVSSSICLLVVVEGKPSLVGYLSAI